MTMMKQSAPMGQRQTDQQTWAATARATAIYGAVKYDPFPKNQHEKQVKQAKLSFCFLPASCCTLLSPNGMHSWLHPL
jgi:hypothetical protein